MKHTILPLSCYALLFAVGTLLAEKPLTEKAIEFPAELVEFGPASEKPLLAGTDAQHWDKQVRERGWIMREDDQWHLWYTGYNDELSKDRFLGYATSPDGLNWTRWPGNPLTKQGWVEDMCIIKQGDTYFMFAEGRDDIAHLLTSKDRVHWQEQGELDIRMTNGQPISSGPRGTPTAWFENDTWWLFYERKDLAVYVATSKDMKRWTNVIDEPCIALGPDDYDRYAVAIDQIVKLGDRYFAYYHASALPKWGEWTTCIATSDDLVHWKKYSKNPIIPVNPASKGASSGTVIHDGKSWRMYTTHPDVRVYFPRASALQP
jgi:beta-1,2-mannobiose phosphorylase / 1,2-beta-oligomannan phosphorylase